MIIPLAFIAGYVRGIPFKNPTTMPFTFSHPAIILPANRLSGELFSMTGLVIGSMTPDFEYFIRMNLGSIFSHTLHGLFYFDLPIGLTLCFIFHDLVRNDLINSMPTGLYERFYALKNFDWNTYYRKKWPVVLLSIVIGAVSHILWDSFTHPCGYFVLKLPILQNRIHFAGFTITIYNFLQQISSVIGLVVVFFFIYRMPKTKTGMNHIKSPYRIYIICIVSAIMVLRFIFGLSITQYGNVIASLMSAFFISIIITPVILRTQSNL
ncbi:MAG TPA: DUF4184 family protein [Puia sp.]|nr:DUF4184 family protein [Puia sp.]